MKDGNVLPNEQPRVSTPDTSGCDHSPAFMANNGNIHSHGDDDEDPTLNEITSNSGEDDDHRTAAGCGGADGSAVAVAAEQFVASTGGSESRLHQQHTEGISNSVVSGSSSTPPDDESSSGSSDRFTAAAELWVLSQEPRPNSFRWGPPRGGLATPPARRRRFSPAFFRAQSVPANLGASIRDR